MTNTVEQELAAQKAEKSTAKLVSVLDEGLADMHSALLIQQNGESFLYDPGGSFQTGTRGSGDVLYNVSVQDYITYHHGTGSTVVIRDLNISPADVTDLLTTIDRLGWRSPLYCACTITNAIETIPAFNGINQQSSISFTSIVTPRRLLDAVNERLR